MLPHRQLPLLRASSLLVPTTLQPQPLLHAVQAVPQQVLACTRVALAPRRGRLPALRAALQAQAQAQPRALSLTRSGAWAALQEARSLQQALSVRRAMARLALSALAPTEPLQLPQQQMRSLSPVALGLARAQACALPDQQAAGRPCLEAIPAAAPAAVGAAMAAAVLQVAARSGSTTTTTMMRRAALDILAQLQLGLLRWPAVAATRAVAAAAVARISPLAQARMAVCVCCGFRPAALLQRKPLATLPPPQLQLQLRRALDPQGRAEAALLRSQPQAHPIRPTPVEPLRQVLRAQALLVRGLRPSRGRRRRRHHAKPLLLLLMTDRAILLLPLLRAVSTWFCLSPPLALTAPHGHSLPRRLERARGFRGRSLQGSCRYGRGKIVFRGRNLRNGYFFARQPLS